MRTIVFASGKGGVGKSTLSVCTALLARDEDARVGILDCDILGSSVDSLLDPDIFSEPYTQSLQDGSIIPLKVKGIYLISIGMFLPLGYKGAIAWRGLLIQKMIRRFFTDIAWPSSLDYLVIDTPPGTTDTHLSLFRLLSRENLCFVVVSTPQEVCWRSAYKTIDLAEKLSLSLSFILENMAYFTCDKCKKKSFFSSSSSSYLSDEHPSPLVLPLLMEQSITEIYKNKEIKKSLSYILDV